MNYQEQAQSEMYDAAAGVDHARTARKRDRRLEDPRPCARGECLATCAEYADCPAVVEALEAELAELEPLTVCGEDYNRGVVDAVDAARVFIARRELEAARHYILIGKLRADYINFETFTAADPFATVHPELTDSGADYIRPREFSSDSGRASDSATITELPVVFFARRRYNRGVLSEALEAAFDQARLENRTVYVGTDSRGYYVCATVREARGTSSIWWAVSPRGRVARVDDSAQVPQ